MGKGGRIACIFVPFALTIVTLVCILLVQLGGWNAHSTDLNSLYFFRANFTNLNVTHVSKNSSSTLTAALELAKTKHRLDDVYEIHLWNYCTSNSSNGTIDKCSSHTREFVFDPVDVWGLNVTATNTSTAANASATTPSDAAIQSIVNGEGDIGDYSKQLESQLLGEAGEKALAAYHTVARWMFIGFQVALWTTIITLVVSLFAIFSRWGSFLTWIFSVLSTIFTIGSIATATVLFTVLGDALKTVLDPYQVTITLGTRAFAVGWIGAAASLLATLFWLFSVCCCSGKSNPHHYSNKGGLWVAEPRGRGYYGGNRDSLHAEKVGFNGYQRVASPIPGMQGPQYGDNMPLNQFSAPNLAYEPYRHV